MPRPARTAAALGAALFILAPAAASASTTAFSIEPRIALPAGPEIVVATPNEQRLVSTQGTGAIVLDVSSSFSAPTTLHTVTSTQIDALLAADADFIGADDNPVTTAVTSVATRDNTYAILGVQTQDTLAVPVADAVAVLDLTTGTLVEAVKIASGVDAVATNATGTLAAAAIESECRAVETPDLNGSVELLTTAGAPSTWTTQNIPVDAASPDLLDVVDDGPDPSDSNCFGSIDMANIEPEYVDFNAANELAVTLQENNAIAIFDADSPPAMIGDNELSPLGLASYGADTLDNAGTYAFNAFLTREREPDAIKWTPDGETLVTANESEADDGDGLQGGRDFSIITRTGSVLFTASTAYDRKIADWGFLDDTRNDNAGSEPEGLAIQRYAGRDYVFVVNERAAGLSVYDITDRLDPSFVQHLPTGDQPESAIALARGFVVSADEAVTTLSVFKRTPPVALSRTRPQIAGDDTPFFDARGLGTAADGRLLFVDAAQPHRIGALTVGLPGFAPLDHLVESAVASPQDVEPVPGGGYWIATATSTKELVRLNADGSEDEAIDLPGVTAASGVARAADGTLYATSRGGSPKVFRVVSGVPTELTFTGGGPSVVNDLALAGNGDLLLLQQATPFNQSQEALADAFISRYAISGTTLGTPTTVSTITASSMRSNKGPSGLARTADGALWVVNANRRLGNSDLRLVTTLAPPVNGGLPVLTGEATPGQSLACSDGTWSNGSPTFTRRWLRNGVVIGGQTAGTYTVVAGDVGRALTCEVTATTVDGTAVATSAAVTAVRDGATGPAGPAGPTGQTGPTGSNGNTGATGPVGATGAAGAKGETGPAGTAGATGAVGPQGPAGAQGAAGAQGPRGATGPRGAVPRVTCRQVGTSRRIRCTTTTSSGRRATASVRLVRGSSTVARGTVSRSGKVVLTPARNLAKGAYTLVVGTTRITVRV